MDITEEMRQAVYVADCERYGHVMDISAAISNNPDVNPDEHTIAVRGPSADVLPHLLCQRCRKVWLVVDDPGSDYDDAVARLAASDPAQLARPAAALKTEPELDVR